MANTADVVKEALTSLLKESSRELLPETRLAEDLMLKSVNRIELAALLEDQLLVTISNFDILKPRTVGDIIEMINKKLKR